jgi:hypothetical protein
MISESARAKAAAQMRVAMLQGSADGTPTAAVDPYAYRWRELRRRQERLLYAAAVCLIASGIGVSLLPSNITRFGVVIVTVLAMIPFVSALGAYPCPRCKKPFFERPRDEHADYFARQCLHCGLMIGTSKADAEAALGKVEPEIRIIR